MEEHAQAARGEALPQHLLAEALDHFLEGSSLKKGAIKGYRFNARIIVRLLGHHSLHEINRRVLANFVATRKRTGVADVTIRRDLAVLSSVFTMAICWGWADTSPVTAFSKKTLKLGRPRTRFLARDELTLPPVCPRS
ncbi:site-specific integrase [Methylobacterium haplocladii]|uniref:site-specific integrase n=2 Tax=Methylobacterium haplocladii TaxID=1176176 RepID=UPI0024E0F6F4|nr:site-specific integrase [Methylobacterium haplocladii]